jgi:hypothetical protein
MGQGAEEVIDEDSTVLENFPKFGGGFRPSLRGKVCLCSYLDSSEPTPPQFIASSWLKQVDGHQSIMVAERDLSADRWKENK